MQRYWAEKTTNGYRPCYTQADGLERRDLPTRDTMLEALTDARRAMAERKESK
jgi:hypothetical protein